jgi:hypothetical protein
VADSTAVALEYFSMIADDWIVQDGQFTAPLVAQRFDQTLLFSQPFRNGSITADVTIIESLPSRNKWPLMEATLVARYSGPDNYWYAGTGGFGSKFFIGKAIPGPFWLPRVWVGQPTAIGLKKTYRLRLDFLGSQITLYENNVRQLMVIDENNQLGQCGLKTWGTRARFENVRVVKSRPRAFLIMPFISELDFVHRVINEKVAEYGIECIRADQMALSRPVMDDVKQQIAEVDLVIVDFTGKNPNVYYEAGLADAWKKDWIVLTQSAEDLTFDVRHIRSIQYSNTMGADIKLRTDLENALMALNYSPTPRPRKPLNQTRAASSRSKTPRK